MAEQQGMFTPTPEEAQENLERYWESYLEQQFGAIAASEGLELPHGMVKALAKIMAITKPKIDETLGTTLLLMSEAYEAGMLTERRRPQQYIAVIP